MYVGVVQNNEGYVGMVGNVILWYNQYSNILPLLCVSNDIVSYAILLLIIDWLH